ncbi:hypothetical protein NMY22_g18137 [Coprinellus aureogranulatus]|nr:hypothetical protein NMY22_g18137 [Coprinellus aureogranulatus]
MSTPNGRRSSSRAEATYSLGEPASCTLSESKTVAESDTDDGSSSSWLGWYARRLRSLPIEDSLNLRARKMRGSVCHPRSPWAGDTEGEDVPFAVSRTSVANAEFCCPSNSDLRRSTLTRSQWDTLKGTKKPPKERSHQQRSTARMTVGMGPV